MMSAVRTLVYLVRNLKNWPLFIYDWILSKFRSDQSYVTFRFRDGSRLAVRPGTTDKWVITDIWMRDPYWHPKFRLSDDPIFLDVGAHIGAWTVFMARRFPKARVIACEPIPENFALLQQNIYLNRLGSVTVFKVALAPRTGTIKLYFDPAHSAYSAEQPRAKHKLGNPRQVRALALTDCLQQAKAPRVDLLKCDIEGAEFPLLLSLPGDTLRRIANISLEYHLFQPNHNLQTLVTFLDKHGFELLEHVPTLPDSGYAKFRLH